MISDAEVEAFRRDGFLVLPGVVRGAELAALRSAADRVMDEAVRHGQELDDRVPVAVANDHGFWDWKADDATGFLYARDAAGRRVWRRAEPMYARDPAFRVTAANPDVIAVVERIHGAPVLPGNDALVVKMPAAGAAVPWHRYPNGQSLIETVGDASSDFTCDIYLDDSSVDNGCVYAVPGSHRATAEGGVVAAGDDLDFTRADAVPLEAAAGDLLLHSTGVLHGSPTNTGGALRRTFYLHYQVPAVIKQILGRDDAWIASRSAELDEWTAERQSVLA